MQNAVHSLVLAVVFANFCWAETRQPQAPDVVFIVVDDLNDWISLLDAERGIRTPNLERLAGKGTLFTKAYCISPACNPSRAATLTGLRPSTTGVYGNKSDWRSAIPNRKTIMQQFMAAGYDVRGAGKIFHHHLDGAFHDDASFEDFQPMRRQLYPPQKLNGAPEYGSRNTDWGKWPPSEPETVDFQTSHYCQRVLSEHVGQRPLFLACGIFKPHSPFFAPAKWHRPETKVSLPIRREDDLSDLPSGALNLLRPKKWFWQGLEALEKKRNGSYLEFVKSYAACVRFADAQIGKILEAIENRKSPRDTIIVLWSDHGFHLGEKDHIEKFALWEKSTHIPFIVVAPGITQPGSVCHRPVDLSSLYPTLLELAGIDLQVPCDGPSLLPLLVDTDAIWEHPALMTYGKGNHAVRSSRWRYICYADGTEELYDHEVDPNEWKNLATDSDFAQVLQSHRAWLPKTEAAPVANLTPTSN